MMVPQLSDAQIKRLKHAYYQGYESADLGKRFGVSPSEVARIARGEYIPLKYVVGEGSSVTKDDDTFSRRLRIRSCRLHLLDLVTEYRPDVLDTYRARRSEALKASIDSKIVAPPVIQEEEVSDTHPIIEPHLTRRSMRILKAALKRFNLSVEEMTGNTRTVAYVRARQITMYVIYSECSNFESTPSIGRMFNKDHSTVVHAVHRMRDKVRAGDQSIIEHVNALKEVR